MIYAPSVAAPRYHFLQCQAVFCFVFPTTSTASGNPGAHSCYDSSGRGAPFPAPQVHRFVPPSCADREFSLRTGQRLVAGMSAYPSAPLEPEPGSYGPQACSCSWGWRFQCEPYPGQLRQRQQPADGNCSFESGPVVEFDYGVAAVAAVANAVVAVAVAVVAAAVVEVAAAAVVVVVAAERKSAVAS